MQKLKEEERSGNALFSPDVFWDISAFLPFFVARDSRYGLDGHYQAAVELLTVLESA